MRLLHQLFFCAIGCLFVCTANASEAKVAIIIDDMGYRLTDQRAFELPQHITFAILPHTEQSKQFALAAHQQGRAVMLHLPMETLQPRNLGQGALMASMNADSIAYTLDQALLSVPHAMGVNNHMGSKLTQLTFPMTKLMEALSKRDLFFIDSRTTRYTKAFQIAEQTGVPALERQVFLDHELNEDFITKQFFRLIRLSKKYGQAIGIAHPHPLTVNILKSLIEQRKEVQFVSITELFDPTIETLDSSTIAVSKSAITSGNALILESSSAN